MYDGIDTPAVLIDMDKVDGNLNRFQSYCDARGLKLRPHIKTHKLPLLARRQVAGGAVGINCQKIGEAEVMAGHGLDDILITYNILGEAKLARLRSLAGRIARLAVTADSQTVVKGLSAAFADAPGALDVLVECDTGGRRCGVQTPEQAARLAAFIAASPGLRFKGLMTYPAVAGTAAVQSFMSAAKELAAENGLACEVVSSGGSPDMWRAHEAPVVTEYRVGTYIYNDRSLIARGTCAESDCALRVMATVVSVPAAGRAVIDAGSKTLTSDLLGQTGFGLVVDHPEVVVSGLSEEHGQLEYPRTLEPFRVGQRIMIIPNHACVVSNLFDTVTLVRGHRVEQTLRVEARGKVL